MTNSIKDRWSAVQDTSRAQDRKYGVSDDGVVFYLFSCCDLSDMLWDIDQSHSLGPHTVIRWSQESYLSCGHTLVQDTERIYGTMSVNPT